MVAAADAAVADGASADWFRGQPSSGASDHSILLEDSLIALTPQQVEMFSQVERSINPTCC